MILRELRKLLDSVAEAHPDADDAEVWASSKTCKIHVGYVGYDKRHKPPRIKLEE